MKTIITGGAGFIGSHLGARLLDQGHEVVAIDNFHLGRRENIAALLPRPGFTFFELDLLDLERTKQLFVETRPDLVYHLAANSDIAAGTSDRGLDLRLNLTTTLHTLESLVACGARRLFFASTSAVFGDNETRLHELSAPLQPISHYGASKLAAEAYISTYCHHHGLDAWVLRFPNVVGEHATHGILFDFIRKLRATPGELVVLGDGMQAKNYLYVSDLLQAIELQLAAGGRGLSVYHAGNHDVALVRDVAAAVVRVFGTPQTRIRYTGGERGWPGDVPRFDYDTSKLRRLGFAEHWNSLQAIEHALRRIREVGF